MPTHFDGTAKEVRALNAYIKLMRATERMAQQLAVLLGKEGITLGQLAVLEALLHLGPLSQKALCQKLLRSGSNVTTVVDNLEREGFVTRRRDEADRRLVTVALTRAGDKLIARVFPLHAADIARLLSGLSGEEQDALGALAKKLGKSLDEGSRSP